MNMYKYGQVSMETTDIGYPGARATDFRKQT